MARPTSIPDADTGYHRAMKKAAKSKLVSNKSGPRYPSVPAKAVSVLREVERALAANDLSSAERALALALVLAPDHPQTFRLLGRTQYQRGDWAEAARNFAAVSAAMPHDVDNLIDLGRAQSANGEHVIAAATLQHASEQRNDAATLIELGIVLDAGANAEAALEVADRLIAMEPESARARLLRARSLQALGCINDTAAEYRELIGRGQEVASAWFALMDIKTIRLDAVEHAALKMAYDEANWSDVERSMLGYAMGRACEDAGEYAAAVEAFGMANRLARRRVTWDSARWTRHVGDISGAFENVTESAPAGLGSEVIFIVGLPRSGTTLVEQILAAHPAVEGANELPDIAVVIENESRRRRIPFPQWVEKANAADWEGNISPAPFAGASTNPSTPTRCRKTGRTRQRFARCCRAHASSIRGATRLKPPGRVSNSCLGPIGLHIATTLRNSRSIGATTMVSCARGLSGTPATCACNRMRR